MKISSLLEDAKSTHSKKVEELRSVLSKEKLESNYEEVLAALAKVLTSNNISTLSSHLGLDYSDEDIDFTLKMVQKALPKELNAAIQTSMSHPGGRYTDSLKSVLYGRLKIIPPDLAQRVRSSNRILALEFNNLLYAHTFYFSIFFANGSWRIVFSYCDEKGNIKSVKQKMKPTDAVKLIKEKFDVVKAIVEKKIDAIESLLSSTKK